MRGASSVTFYAADPLKGGKATQTVKVTGNDANAQAEITQVAKTAIFAVVERNGEQIIVDLSATARGAAPQGPQRR
ncbi:hypothetical protein LAJ19_16350 (plasmid) [Deinococcus taeanensis]|uniref:hypothetical protein n=1 Tax=Deinococcus taeanensis TaxID=2737050 RepID=UPI001CDD7E86|nr:hypothetical protein [Deinococcus taeanensis]UBV44727.1 hypothetical protein LAJ19_16350 [Deinococcus taeanensis]